MSSTPGWIEWQVAMLASVGIDAAKVDRVTVEIDGEGPPRFHVSWVPDRLSDPPRAESLRLVPIEGADD